MREPWRAVVLSGGAALGETDLRRELREHGRRVASEALGASAL
ncbi:MAG: hypothetical protein QGH45_14030 [Myxococcota bacterium]|jgi:predicted ATPase|nr:hypothetical protein [Myxococcota bacterium]